MVRRFKFDAGTPASILIIVLLAVTLFDPAIGLWVDPAFIPFPAGGALRDVLILAVLSYAAIIVFFTPRKSSLSLVFPLLCAWVVYVLWVIGLVLADTHPLATLINTRNHIAFPLVGLLTLLIVTYSRSFDALTLQRSICFLGIMAALLGIVDFATRGGMLETLGYQLEDFGYRLDYEGDSERFVGNRLTNVTGNGVVDIYYRASGGLTNPLVYGYSMAIFTTYAMFKPSLLSTSGRSEVLDKVLTTSLLILAPLAALLTLTRGPVLLIVLNALLFLGGNLFIYRRLRFSRSTVLVSLLAVSLYLVVLSSTGYGNILYERFVPEATETSAATPTEEPAGAPAATPTGEPAATPTEEPAGAPAATPTGEPAATPTEEPAGAPAATPTEEPAAISMTANTGHSNSTRVEQVYAGIDTLINDPLGIGIGTQGTGRTTELQMVTDIYFLWVALEIGIPGLVLLLIVLFTNFYLGFRYGRYERRSWLLFSSLALTLCVAGNLSAAFTTPLIVIFYGVILNVEIGLLIRERNTHPQNQATSRKSDEDIDASPK